MQGLYLSDIQDHITTSTQNLTHYEKILSRSHSNYLAQISIEMSVVGFSELARRADNFAALTQDRRQQSDQRCAVEVDCLGYRAHPVSPSAVFGGRLRALHGRKSLPSARGADDRPKCTE